MAPRYGDFTFDSSSGFTGSVKRKAFKHGGYAEGGMRPKRAYNGEGVPPSYRRAMLDVENGDYLTPERLIELTMGQKEADDPAANKGQGPTRNNAYRMEYLRKQEDMKPSYMKKTKRYSSDEPPYASSSNPPHFPEMKRGGKVMKKAEGYSKGGPKKLTPGEDPRQMLLGDISPVTQKERLNAAAAKPMRGSSNQKSADDLFRPLEPDMLDLMKRSKGGKVGYAGGGLHKMRSDKGVTGKVPGVKMGRSSTKIPGMLAPMNAGPKIKNPTVTATSSPLSNIALKRGGKAKK